MEHNNINNSRNIIIVEIMIMACFALSGLAALMYQTAWMRLFSISFGTSELSIAAVLAAYMAGLALGSMVAGRYADKLAKPVRIYALLEGGIAITALLVPFFISLASWMLLQLLGLQESPPNSTDFGQTLYYLVATFLIVGIPTGLMGATLPILAHHIVQHESQIGTKIGLLYGINTAGAVVGVVVSGFYLLPELGLNGVVWVAVAINGLIFLIARKIPAKDVTTISYTKKIKREWDDVSWILPLMLISGSISFVYEVLWTRLLSHIMSSSIYAFATMLATFLTGIALGGWLGGWLTRYLRQPVLFFSFIQIAIGLLAATTYYLLDNYYLTSYTTLGQFGLAAVLMMPATIFIGATYPVAVRIYTSNVEEVGAGSARVYAWNTVGAIIGAIAAGFFMLPVLGFEGTARLTSLLNITLALLALCLISKSRWLAISPIVVIFFGAVIFYKPLRPMNVINSSSIYLNEYEQFERYYAVGRSSTVLLNESRFQFHMRTNGLPEADINFKGGMAFRNTQRWLGLLPVVARPDTESMLIIGLGGGVAVEGVPPSVSDIDVIELEQEVVNANLTISQRRMIDPLSQARVNLVVNDARNALTLSAKKYDAIVSQPSHPWTAGASHLFTREFIQLAKSRLNDNGVFLMWMNTEYVTPELLKSLAATVQNEFTHVRVYQTEAQVLNFIASDTDLDIEQQIINTGKPFIDQRDHYLSNGIFGSPEIIAALLLDEEGVKKFVVGAPASTDNKNLMATESVADASGMLEADLFGLIMENDPLYDVESWLRQSLNDEELLHIASRALSMSQKTRYDAIVKTISSKEIRFIGEAFSFYWDNNTSLYYSRLRQAYDENNSNQIAAYLLIEDEFDALVSGQGTNEAIKISKSLSGNSELVLKAWGLYKNQKWDELKLLDDELSQIQVIEAWYPRAVELRALWRLNAGDITRNEIIFAKNLIDSANLLIWAPRLFHHRVLAGKLLADPYILMESIIQVGASIDNELSYLEMGYTSFSYEIRDEMIMALEEYIELLDEEILRVVGERGLWAKKELELLKSRLSAI